VLHVFTGFASFIESKHHSISSIWRFFIARFRDITRGLLQRNAGWCHRQHVLNAAARTVYVCMYVCMWIYIAQPLQPKQSRGASIG